MFQNPIYGVAACLASAFRPGGWGGMLPLSLYRFVILFIIHHSTFIISQAQTRLTEQAYLQKALAYSPAARAAMGSVEQSRRLEGTRNTLPDLVVTTESPTGDFYTVGALQNFRLPGFYQKQGHLLQSQTRLAGTQALSTQARVLQRARSFYLNAQYYTTLDSLSSFQDSLYRSIAQAAQRLNKAGQIDALQAAFAQSQADEAGLSRRANAQAMQTALVEMRQLAGLEEAVLVSTLFSEKALPVGPNFSSASSPSLRLATENLSVAKAQIAVEKARFKPSFVAGFLNQGPRTTPALLRMRGGIDIPLWTRQYSSSIKAAQIGQKVAEHNLAAAHLNFSLDSLQITGSRSRLLAAVREYEQKLDPQADRIITASTRLRTAGEVDVINHLRIVNEAFAIKLRYLEAVRQYRESLIAGYALSYVGND